MSFSAEVVQKVWEHARAMPGRDPIEWRKDECGAWIRNSHYGSPDSEFGWKIEIISPGGGEDIGDLRPFHRANSYDRGTGQAHCHITADRDHLPPTTRIDAPGNKAIR